MDKHQREEEAARRVGYSRSTMYRVGYIREMAEADLPVELHEVGKVARKMLTRMTAVGVLPAYETVKEAEKQVG